MIKGWIHDHDYDGTRVVGSAESMCRGGGMKREGREGGDDLLCQEPREGDSRESWGGPSWHWLGASEGPANQWCPERFFCWLPRVACGKRDWIVARELVDDNFFTGSTGLRPT